MQPATEMELKACFEKKNSPDLPPSLDLITRCTAPTDLCLTDLDRILPVEQDPGAHHYSVPGTVPIKEEPLRFWVPMQIIVLGTVPIKKKRF